MCVRACVYIYIYRCTYKTHEYIHHFYSFLNNNLVNENKLSFTNIFSRLIHNPYSSSLPTFENNYFVHYGCRISSEVLQNMLSGLEFTYKFMFRATLIKQTSVT